jgi:hypothetical protein
MKEETNNEIDLLLRRLGRRPDMSVSDGNGDVDHLDADELNAYAENVLPAAARARYAGHLAECARCRELVVQLSSSAAVVPLGETVKAPAPSVLSKFLARFFSPLVLRYAVPALGLIVVAAIGVFVLRQKQNGPDSIAKNVETQAPISITTPPATMSDGPASKPFVEPKQEAAAKPAQGSGSPANESAAAAAPQATPAPEVPAESPRQELAKEPQPITAAAPPPRPAVADTAQAKTEAPSPQGQAANEPPAERAKAISKDRQEAEIAAASSSSAAKKGVTISALHAAEIKARSQRDDAVDKDKNAADSETRTVAGRKFRRRGGIWIDTGYDSARAIIELRRGSEQYRALIADEPGIKTIADQLDGEILLVWKGRPYHIR